MTLPYKILGALALALALVGAGYWKGYSGQHDALVAYRAQIATAAAIQIQTVKTQEVKNDTNTQAVAKNYAADSRSLDVVLNGLRKPSSNHASSLSGIAIHPVGTGAPVIQPGGTRQGNCDESADDPCLIKRGIFDSAMRDAQAWEAVQDWLVREEIPVK